MLVSVTSICAIPQIFQEHMEQIMTSAAATSLSDAVVTTDC